MRTYHCLFAILLALQLQACHQKTEEQKTVAQPAKNAKTYSEASTSKATGIESKNGFYELADVLVWSMPKHEKTHPQRLPDLQDYNNFKGVITEISSAKEVKYEGRVSILVDGKRAIADNIEDDYKWRVLIDGPNVGASSISFYSDRAISVDAGPAYLRRKGFQITLLTCFSEGGTPTNATALYLAQFADRQPTLLSYSVSTGSGGVFLKFQLFFGPVSWSDVPGATQVGFTGAAQPFGNCVYKEFF